MKKLILIFSLILLASCSNFNSSIRDLLSSKDWELTPYNAKGLKITLIPPTGFWITIPPKPSYVNSIQRRLQLKAGQTITVKYRVSTVSGTPVFQATEGTDPANFSVMFARGLVDERWYVAGINYVKLQDALDKGIQVYSVKLTPELWQDVRGHQFPDHFNNEIQDARIVEIVFGGQFRAHGIEVRGGTVKFEVLDFSIK